MNLAINQLLKLFSLSIFCIALLFSGPDSALSNQTINTDQQWTSETLFTNSQFIASSAAISINTGSTIKVPANVELIFSGKLKIVGNGVVTFKPEKENESWPGLHFRNADDQVLKSLKITGATTGIRLENSGGVEITESQFSENGTAIAVASTDGIRSRQNKIHRNTISNNDIGISASSTGVIVEKNHLVNIVGTAINLSGNTCGAGSRCGYHSTVTNNLIENVGRGVSSFGHFIQIVRNDNTPYLTDSV